MSKQEKTVWLNRRVVRVDPSKVPSSDISGKMNMPLPIPVPDEMLMLGGDMIAAVNDLAGKPRKIEGIEKENLSEILTQQPMYKEAI
jgi:hypothetical protein